MFQILIKSYLSIFASFLDSAILNNDIALYLFFLRREVVCANIHKILSLQHLQAIWILRAKQQEADHNGSDLIKICKTEVHISLFLQNRCLTRSTNYNILQV